jgi:hypothetical protein
MQYLIMTSDEGDVDWKTKSESLKREARYLWSLAEKGIVRNIWFTENTRDAVLMLEADSEQQAAALMAEAPLVDEGLIGFKVVGLTAYTGFERLFNGTD